MGSGKTGVPTRAERVQIRHRGAESTVPQVYEDPITVGLDKAIHVDFSKLAAPSNTYDADHAWIGRHEADISLFFGKSHIDPKKGLRTRIELRYPVECFLNHFWENSREFHKRLRTFADKWPAAKAAPRVAEPWKLEAVRDHSEWVTFEALAHVGSAAMMDFYLVPAVGVARFHRGQGSKGLTVVPVVRVQLTIFELLRLMDAAEAQIDEIRALVPQSEQELEVKEQ